MRRITFIAGVATGYVLGARAGRGHYEKIKTVACKVSNSKAAHTAVDKATDAGGKLVHTAMDKAPGWVPGSHPVDEGMGTPLFVNGRGSSNRP